GQEYRSLVWFADATAVHSRFMRDELTRPTRYPTERIHFTPLLVEADSFYPAPSRFLHERLRLPDAHFLLFAGRFSPNKRVSVLVQALAILRDEHPPIHAVIVGDDSDIYHAEAEHCRRLAQNLRIADRVHFLGHVSADELVAAY